MKFLIFCLLFSCNLIGQVWVEKDAVWHYNIFDIAIDGFYKITYDSDSIIHGQDCQVLVTKEYSFHMINSQGEIGVRDSSIVDTNYTYVSGDTVFYLDNNQFFVLYNFGAQIGDRWLISTTPSLPERGCVDSSWVEVINIGKETINSTVYRTIEIETIGNSAFGLSGVFVERFGPIRSTYLQDGFLFPLPQLCDWVILEIMQYSFKCFTDQSFDLYRRGEKSCEYLLENLSIQEFKIDLEFYPNPVSDYLTLAIAESGNIKLKIIDISGKLVMTVLSNSSENRIDLSSLNSGLYWVDFINENRIIKTDKLIKL